MASAYRQFPAQSSCEICLSSWRTFTRRDHLGINRVPHSSSTWGALGSSTSFIYGCSFGLSSRSTSLNRALTMALGHGCSAKQLRMRSLSLCLQPRHISTLTITPILSTSVMYTFEILQPLTGRAHNHRSAWTENRGYANFGYVHTKSLKDAPANELYYPGHVAANGYQGILPVETGRCDRRSSGGASPAKLKPTRERDDPRRNSGAGVKSVLTPSN